jgi:glycosyltransferase involved in cell wall biosynthesis
VLPFGDAADTIADAIDSLRGQTLSTFECVLIDNRSSDASRTIAQSICRIDPRFRIITQSGSFVDALNAGWTAARSPLIARMDADDVAAPRRLEAQHALLVADSSLALASCLVSAFPHRRYATGCVATSAGQLSARRMASANRCSSVRSSIPVS